MSRSRMSTRLTTAIGMVVAALVVLPSPAHAAGTATVKGTIRDTGGAAVAGATVRSRPADGVGSRSTATATSAADGSYSLRIPADEPTQVCASAPGRVQACYGGGTYTPDTTPAGATWPGVGEPVDVAAGGTRDGVSFALGVPARVRGRLVDTTGRPAAGVRVQAHTDDVRGDDDVVTATSGSNGAYELVFTSPSGPPADYCLVVAEPADDGYATAHRYRTDVGGGTWFGCTRTVRVGDQLTDDFVLTPDGTRPVRNLATPYFVGTPKVGYTLSARPGRWEPGTPTLTYSWFDGPRRLGRGATYVVKPSELGHAITLRATAVAPGRAATAVAWTKPDRVVRGTFWLKRSPRITGPRKVGRTLTVRPAPSAPAGHRRYRWLRNGKAIKGATATRYRVRSADRGKRLSVRVHYSQKGYHPTKRTSPRTSRIR